MLRLSRLHSLVAGALLILVLVADGAAESSGRRSLTLAGVADGAFIARHLPRIAYAGGPFLRRPEVITVTFAGDDPALVARLERFGAFVTRSNWWREVAGGYCIGTNDCIGEGRGGRAVSLDAGLPARVRDIDIERLLEREAESGSLARLDDEAIVLVYLPARVTLGDAFHPHYCAGGPRAYHRMLRSKDISFAYAVIPRCGGEAMLTGVASHEILEAATNPDPNRRGFAIEPVSGNEGFMAAGPEPVDPCGLINRDRHWTSEEGFALQRAWSNRAAAEGRDPCVPSRAGDPYFALIPREPAVRLAGTGAVARLALDAASDRAVDGWDVSAIDLTGLHEGKRYVEAALSRSRVASGDSATLTLRLLNVHPRRDSIVGIVSTRGPHAHLWPLLVNMR